MTTNSTVVMGTHYRLRKFRKLLIVQNSSWAWFCNSKILGSGDEKMKKFFQGKVMDYKFRKAGEGHRLNEEKPPPSLPESQSGEPLALALYRYILS